MRDPRARLCVVLAACALAAGAAEARAARIVALEPVAFSGTPAPGLAVPFQGFSRPRIDSAGRVGFSANAAGESEASVDGVWLWSEGDGLALVTTFAAPPGVPAPMVSLWSLVVTARGVSLAGALAHENGVDYTNDHALWEQDGGALALLAWGEDAAPLAGRRFGWLGGIRAGDAASVFRAHLFATPGELPAEEALFRHLGAGVIEPVAVVGTPAFEAATSWTLIGSSLLDPSGRVAFFGQVSDGVAAWFGLFASDGAGGYDGRMRQGDPAPGTDSSFNAVNPDGGQWGMNAAGEVAFIGMRALGIGDGERAAVWGPDELGGLRLLALEGEPGPGPAAGVYQSFWELALSSDGWSVFSGELAGAEGVAVWAAARSGPTLLVAARGMEAGIEGAVVEHIEAFAVIVGGRVLVQGHARRLGSGEDVDALWIRELPDGPLEPLLVEGDRIDVEGAQRTLHGFQPFPRAIEIANTASGVEDGKGPGANDAGQLAVVLRTLDDEPGAGSGVFRLTLPEPATSTPAALAVLLLLGIRRSRR